MVGLIEAVEERRVKVRAELPPTQGGNPPAIQPPTQSFGPIDLNANSPDRGNVVHESKPAARFSGINSPGDGLLFATNFNRPIVVGAALAAESTVKSRSSCLHAHVKRAIAFSDREAMAKAGQIFFFPLHGPTFERPRRSRSLISPSAESGDTCGMFARLAGGRAEPGAEAAPPGPRSSAFFLSS